MAPSQLVQYHLPLQLPKETSRHRLYDDSLYFFFLMPVLLSPQHNFSFHEINSDYIRFHLFETEM